MAPSIKLYYFPMACSVGPQLLLEDAGLAYEAIKIDIRDPAAKENYTKTINPKGQVPAITVDGELITEIPAIFTAISQLAPAKHYTGSTASETVRFYEWVSYIGSTVHAKSFGPMFAPQKFSDDAAAQETLKVKGKESVGNAFKFIEGKLAGSKTKFALGENLTGVDAYLAVVVGWTKFFGLFDESAYPSLGALVGRVAELEAAKKVMAFNSA